MSNPNEQINRTNLERFFIARLQRSARIAAKPDSENPRLARWATLSAFRDCEALGLEKEAKDILERTISLPIPPGESTPILSEPAPAENPVSQDQQAPDQELITYQLDRLEFTAQRAAQLRNFPEKSFVREFAARAAFSAYRDCVAAGQQEEARNILKYIEDEQINPQPQLQVPEDLAKLDNRNKSKQELGAYFLTHLQHAIDSLASSEPKTPEAALARFAKKSFYEDCVALGLKKQADEIINKATPQNDALK